MTRRLPEFDTASATPEQQAVLQDILRGPRGSLNGPFLGWIHSPALAQHAQKLGAFCRYETGLPLRQSELAVLVTAAVWQAQAEWFIHHPIALGAGLPAATAEAIRSGQRPAFEDDAAGDDELIFDFAMALNETRRVPQALYDRAVARFGLPVTINLVALLGYYTLVAMTLNVFGMRSQGQGQDSLPFAEPAQP